jgi:hypothetical protein
MKLPNGHLAVVSDQKLFDYLLIENPRLVTAFIE